VLATVAAHAADTALALEPALALAVVRVLLAARWGLAVADPQALRPAIRKAPIDAVNRRLRRARGVLERVIAQA
jgi:hypothetical protein